MAEHELEGDDPVVKEVDVFLNKPAAGGQVYVLQFPIRPIDKTNDAKKYLSAKIKPQQNKLELEVDLDPRNKYYSKAKGEQFAINVDGKPGHPSSASAQQRYYHSSHMDKLVFGSTNGTPGQMNKLYQLGYYKSGAIYLTPVHSILQMRPNFEYFDIYEQKVKEIKGTQPGMDTDYSTEEEAEADQEKAELVTLKYSTHHVQEAEPGWMKADIDQTILPNLKQTSLMFDANVHQERIQLNYNNEELLQRIISPTEANNTIEVKTETETAVTAKTEPDLAPHL